MEEPENSEDENQGNENQSSCGYNTAQPKKIGKRLQEPGRTGVATFFHDKYLLTRLVPRKPSHLIGSGQAMPGISGASFFLTGRFVTGSVTASSVTLVHATGVPGPVPHALWTEPALDWESRDFWRWRYRKGHPAPVS